MNASWMMAGAAAAVMIGGQIASAELVTWKGANGDWNHANQWTPEHVPLLGDDVVINGGTAEYWGVAAGQLGASIHNDSTVTINGGTVHFNVGDWVSVGTGGSGAASALTINAGGTYDMNGGQLGIGNATSGEVGVVTVAAGGSLLSNGAWIEMQTTGTLNSAGTVSGFGDINLRGGIINVTDGTFSATTLKLLGDASTGVQFNIFGGTVVANSLAYNAWEVSYLNFTPGSTGVLQLANVSTSQLADLLAAGRIRVDGVADPGAFTVTAYDANGAQVSLVPEPASVAMLAAGIGLAALRRRGVSGEKRGAVGVFPGSAQG